MSLLSAQLTVASQLLKPRDFRPPIAFKRLSFSVFQALAAFAHCWQNSSAYYQQLTASFCALFVAFRTSNLLFSTLYGLFSAKQGGRG
jgi:hypothetical protein